MASRPAALTRWLLCAAAVLAAAIAAAPAQARAATTLFTYSGFTNASDTALARVGKAKVVPPALRLVDRNSTSFAGSAWYANQVDVTAGWQTRFAWQLSSGPGGAPEGLAFVIQSDGVNALGSAGSGLGFAGITNSVAVAIDTKPTPSLGEPAVPFISVHTKGDQPNSTGPDSALGPNAPAAGLGDGQPHVITVRYLPPDSPGPKGLSIYLDDATAPLLTVPGLDLAKTLGANHFPARVGFTASTGASPSDADITSWSFGPFAEPASLAVTSAPLSATATAQPGLGPVEVSLEDAAGNRVIAPSAVDVTVRSSSASGVFTLGFGVPPAPTMSARILPGQSSAVVYYGDTTAGEPTIIASADGLRDGTQRATITPGPRAAIRLSSAGSAIAAGDEQTYAVDAVDGFGNPLGAVGGAQLAITPDGSCSGTTCTATVAGPHTVTASSGTFSASAKLTVRPAPTASLTLSPAHASVAAGTAQAYVLGARDTYGNDTGPVLDAKLAIGPDGSCSGATCSATVAGAHTVTATSGTVTASADVTVRPGPTASLTLSPGGASVAAGGVQTYALGARDAYGNDVGPVLDAKLSIGPDGTCSGSTCTARVAGPHAVTAVTPGMATASADLTVRPGPLASLRLSPATATITAEDTQPYTVDGSDAFGNPVSVSDVNLDISPTGSCSAGACTAAEPGSHTVKATAGQLTASATLGVLARVTPTPTITPDTDTPASPVTPAAAAPAQHDTTPPSVTCATAPTFVLHSARARVTANVSDAASGPAGAQVSAPADTSTVGTRTVTLTGADGASNQATSACKYTVVYGFRGGQHVAKGGRAVVLKWRLTDAAGAPVITLARARLSVMAISCRPGGSVRRGIGSLGRTLRPQNLGKGSYRLKWKIPARFAKSCLRLRLDLGEGSAAAPIYHNIDLRFGASRFERHWTNGQVATRVASLGSAA